MVNKYLLIPGLGGSRIMCQCLNVTASTTLYPFPLNPFRRTYVQKHFLDCICATAHSEILKSYLKISIYSKLIKFLKTQGHVFIFSYDWREEPLRIVNDLVLFITRNELNRCHIIAHSYGGILTRIMVEYEDTKLEFGQIFLCGTPLLGSLNPLHNPQGNELKNIFDGKESEIKFSLISKRLRNKICMAYRAAFIYFLPTNYFLDRSHCRIKLSEISKYDISENKWIKCQDVHKKLSEFSYRSYIYFFNTSQENCVNMSTATSYTDFLHVLSGRNIMCTDRDFKASYDSLNDGTIMPLCQLWENVVLIHDRSSYSHSFIMNSNFLKEMISIYCKSDILKVRSENNS